MAVDSEPQPVPQIEDLPATDAATEIKLKKGKKRKGDADAAEAPPKKSKKSKVA